MTLPEWILHPDDPAAATMMAADIAGALAMKRLEEVQARLPAADLEAMGRMPRFKAEIAFDAMRLTAQLQATSDISLNQQAVIVERDKLWMHTEYESAEQFFYDALANTNRSKSEASDLHFYAKEIVPFMKARGMEGAGKLWVKDENVGKARAAKPILNRAMQAKREAEKAGDKTGVLQAEQIITKVLEQVVDAKVSRNKFIADHHGTGLPATQMPAFQAWNYIQQKGSIAVLELETEAQRAFVEQSLGDFAQWSLGTGKEVVLERLGGVIVRS